MTEIVDPDHQEIIDSIASILECSSDELTDNASILTVPSWDSMAHIQLIVFLNEKYGVDIDEDNIERFSNFHEIMRLVEGKSK